MMKVILINNKKSANGECDVNNW